MIGRSLRSMQSSSKKCAQLAGGKFRGFSAGREDSSSQASVVIASNQNFFGEIVINKPKVLNALDLDMVRQLRAVVDEWAGAGAAAGGGAPPPRVLWLAGAGGRAFCAGGDVAAVRRAGLGEEAGAAAAAAAAGAPPRQAAAAAAAAAAAGRGRRGLLTTDFFWEEYELDHALAAAPFPQISIWDGIVMGGGVGVSVHGNFRVATENTLFAMPETAIGLVPDVGGSWFLPRLPGGLGAYLALTGARCNAHDLLYSGIATHAVPADRLPELKQAMQSLAKNGSIPAPADSGAVKIILDAFSVKMDGGSLEAHREEIDTCFKDKEAVEDIIDELQGNKSEWAIRTLKMLRKMSPTSLKVTHQMLKEGAKLKSLRDCLRMEFGVVQACMRPGGDFYEGVRAVLVDKDRRPQWRPGTLEEVPPDAVAGFFDRSGLEDDSLLRGPPPRRGEGSGAATAGGIARL